MPPAEPSQALAEATRRRSERARIRAEAALRRAQRAGQPVTVAGFATAAGVSRSWLYTQPDLLTAVDALRHQPRRTATRPDSATVASLRRRLDTALARIRQLRADNADLTHRLETVHGQLRAHTAGTGPGQLPDADTAR
ncbi:DUF6262 family protein [Dactylosporangium sp. CA-139066]|uniref:DUF6262 family protein n=1 Tax=Dactylosporangium sp. CA-139066 TaxID=3239930 RepID=UPI003D90372F